MTASLPVQGRPWEEIRGQMQELRRDDMDWRGGRHAAYVWYANDDLEDVLREAYGMFMVENGLGIRVFHSLARMEAEVLETIRSLLSAPEGAASIFTSGGTESIFVSLTAAREWARAAYPHIADPEFVAPHSAHPALNKAAHLLGFRVRRLPVGPDHRADPAAIEAAIGPNTIGLYASAPSYSLGLIDPILELGAVAERHGLWLHVDACVGGVLAPFVRRLGREVPPFDFAIPGVSSISADLHKSGFAAKPASTAHFRSEELREHARFSFDDWPTGRYSSLTFTGTRPGGAIAAAWAAFQYLGEEGYERLAASSMRARDRLAEGVAAMPEMRVFGEPPLWALAFGREGLDMRAVASAMLRRGWYCSPTTAPPGIHMMCTPVHEPVIDDYLGTLRESVDEVAAGAAPREPSTPARYA